MTFPSEEDVLNLSGKEWKPLPKVARTIPFGYVLDENDKLMLNPVMFELEALEVAKKHLKNGHSLRKVATWLSGVTGRYISHHGLKKRVDIERRRNYQASSLKKWARAYKEALEKAKYAEDRNGGNTEALEAEIREAAAAYDVL